MYYANCLSRRRLVSLQTVCTAFYSILQGDLGGGCGGGSAGGDPGGRTRQRLVGCFPPLHIQWDGIGTSPKATTAVLLLCYSTTACPIVRPLYCTLVVSEVVTTVYLQGGRRDNPRQQVLTASRSI